MVRRRVLIVDDERVLRDGLREHLSLDHDVETAGSVAEAIRRLRGDTGFDVVVCDVQLPDGSGLDVLAAGVGAYPDRAIRFVFVTGGPELAAVRAAAAAGGHRMLLKPYDVDALAALIEELAAGAG
jgi:two-component system response regulator YesN